MVFYGYAGIFVFDRAEPDKTFKAHWIKAGLKCYSPTNKQLLDEVFVISGIIKVEVSVINRSRRLRLITLTVTLIIPDITKTESNNCFIIHCFEENNDKRIVAAINLTLLSVNLTLLLEIMHCARNLQIIH